MSVCRYFTHLCSPSSLFLLATSDHCAWTECNGLQPPLLLHHHNSIIKRTHLTIYINKYKYAMRGCRVWSSPLRLYYVPCVSLCCTRLPVPKSNDMMVKPWIAARLRGSVVLFLSLCLHLPPSCTYTRNTHTVTDWKAFLWWALKVYSCETIPHSSTVFLKQPLSKLRAAVVASHRVTISQ